MSGGRLRGVDARGGVGPVLALGELGGFGVGRLLGIGVDRGPAHLGGRRDRIGVDRHEQVGLGLAGQPHPLGQRHEHVPVAGHPHPVAPPRLQLLDERLGEAEHDVLLEHAAHRDGAGIGAAVAGIDHDQRALVGGFGGGGAGLGGGGIRRGGRLAERLAIDALQGDREQDGPVPGPRHRLDPADGRRACEIDHDAGAAGGEQAVAEGLHEAVAATAGPGFELEVHFRQVDHRPVRSLHHEAAGLDGAGQGQGQAGRARLAREIRRNGDGGLIAVLRDHGRPRPRGKQRDGEAQTGGTDQARATRHRSGIVSRALHSGMGPAWLTVGCRGRFDPGVVRPRCDKSGAGSAERDDAARLADHRDPAGERSVGGALGLADLQTDELGG